MDRNDRDLAENQTCHCVRELDLIRSLPKDKWDSVTTLFSHYLCDKNGNYLPLQCPQSESCYCVDEETGYQVGETKLTTNINGILSLQCMQCKLMADKTTKDCRQRDRIIDNYPNIFPQSSN